MSLQIGALEMILREHQRSPITGRVLTLGRQVVTTSYAEARRLFELLGLEPAPHVPIAAPQSENERISTELFFEMLGVDSAWVLDVLPDDEPDIVADLNDPIPERYHGKFGLVIDGGTLEHVFDVRQAFVNLASLLEPGGRVMHFNPVNNHVNHGFVQFSPTIFFDYYESNGFVDAYAKTLFARAHGRRAVGNLPVRPHRHGRPQQHVLRCGHDAVALLLRDENGRLDRRREAHSAFLPADAARTPRRHRGLQHRIPPQRRV
jgi:SAM-dependent methyltransferase